MDRTRNILLVAYEGANLLDIAGPAQVFASAAEVCEDGGGAPAYRLSLVSRPGGPMMTSTGLAIATAAFAEAGDLPIDTLIVVGGPGVQGASDDPETITWLTSRASGARRICSVCTGAFVLAACGLLDGRRAATHWRWSKVLQARHPRVRVEADPIFVRDGRVWSSAGVSAGIDLALALVEEDLGHAVALKVARRLVVFLKRPGDQAQFSAALAVQATGDSAFGDLHAWMSTNLDRELRVEQLAERAGMSARNFARVYAARTGMTPARAVEAMRVEAARRLLEETPKPVAWVAGRCGFGDDERMRRSFIRWIGVPPTDYRERFRSGLDASATGEPPAAAMLGEGAT